MKTERGFIDSIYAKKRSHDRKVRRYSRVGISFALAVAVIPAAIFIANGDFAATENMGNGGAEGKYGITGESVVVEAADGNDGCLTVDGEGYLYSDTTTTTEDGAINMSSGTAETLPVTTGAPIDEVVVGASGETSEEISTDAPSDTTIAVATPVTEPMQSTAFESYALFANYRTELRRIYKEGVRYADAVIAAVENGDVSDRALRETAYELIFALEKIVESSYPETLNEDELIEITVMANAMLGKLRELYNTLP